MFFQRRELGRSLREEASGLELPLDEREGMGNVCIKQSFFQKLSEFKVDGFVLEVNDQESSNF